MSSFPQPVAHKPSLRHRSIDSSRDSDSDDLIVSRQSCESTALFLLVSAYCHNFKSNRLPLHRFDNFAGGIIEVVSGDHR